MAMETPGETHNGYIKAVTHQGKENTLLFRFSEIYSKHDTRNIYKHGCVINSIFGIMYIRLTMPALLIHSVYTVQY